MSAGHSIQLMWAGVGVIVLLLIVSSVVGRWLPKYASAQIGQSSKKSHLQLAWISVGVFSFLILLASIAEWRLAHVRQSEATLLVNKNEGTPESTQAHGSINQEDDPAFNSELQPDRQECAPSSGGFQGSPGAKLVAHFEAKKSEKESVEFLTTPDVVGAEETMFKSGKRQSETEYKIVQDLIRQVRSPGNLIGVGWAEIDRKAAMLSTETFRAYRHWRKAILEATPPKYSLHDVEATTSGPAEFRSEQALNAKTHLLNIAAQMGPTDSKLVATAIKSVEQDGKGWDISDHLMDKAQTDTSVAYQRWKHAVWSAL